MFLSVNVQLFDDEVVLVLEDLIQLDTKQYTV